MIYFLIALAAASRFLPHPPNVALVGALGLFAGCYLEGSRRYWVPAVAILLSDGIGHFAAIPGMGFYSPIAMAAVYGGLMVSVPIGRWVGGGNRWLRTPLGSVAASTAFFLISNLGVFLAGWYPMTATGFVACFVNAIPFYGYTLAGDLMFTSIIFAAASFRVAKARPPVAVAV